MALEVSAQRQAQRYLVVRVPDWETVSLGVASPPGAAAVTVKRGRVLHASVAARKHGIYAGMKVSSAQLLCPNILIFPADPESEATRFEAVVRSIESQAANVRVVEPGVAWTLAAGPARWHGSEEALAEAIIDAVSCEFGAECVVGIATGTLTALVAAGRGDLVEDDQSQKYLSALPLAMVTLVAPSWQGRFAELIHQLDLLGIRTCGDLASVDETPFIARFGLAARELRSLARGEDIFLPQTDHYAYDIHIRHACEEAEASVERLVIPMSHMGTRVSQALEHSGVYAQEMTTIIVTEDGCEHAKKWGEISSHRGEIVIQRFRWHMNALISQWARQRDPDAAQRVSALEVRLADFRQAIPSPPLWGRDRDEEKLQRSLERLQALLGEQGVVSVQRRGAFDPRHSIHMRPWGTPPSEFPAQEGQWYGQVDDPPEIICTPPIPVDLWAIQDPHSDLPSHKGSDEEEKYSESEAQIIPFPGMPTQDDHRQTPREQTQADTGIIRRGKRIFPCGAPWDLSQINATTPRVSIDARGNVNSYHALLSVSMSETGCSERKHAVKGWRAGEYYALILREPLWCVRGKWWVQNTQNEGEKPRTYVRATTEDGQELLLVCYGKKWWIEGIYERAYEQGSPSNECSR